jgi:hypothetical protein
MVVASAARFRLQLSRREPCKKVNTFDTAFDARKTADDRAGHVTRFGRAIRDAWARLLELPASNHAVETTQAADESVVADESPGILASYYDGAHGRVKAAEPVVSFSKVGQ